MITVRRGEFLDSTMTLSPRYSGSFGASLRDPGMLHDVGKGSDQFHRFLQAGKLRAEEGIYLTKVQYHSPEALHSMRLILPVLATNVRYALDEEIWIATDNITREYGVGNAWDEAIGDYVENLHSMAHWFKTNRKPLGPLMKQQAETYRRLFRDL